MNYKEAIEYLYSHAPMFQKIGERAFKKGLENTLFLDHKFCSPHRNYKTIHVGGTNGKGSCSHLLASVLQSAGYKVGLYTSPHLKSFCERIRINGIMIEEQSVAKFIEQNKNIIETIHPSFFEITTALAFNYFAEQKVDVAIIEVGLGGLLDCTNIIAPELSIITNISYDHINLLGTTLEEIAEQKAGIIKMKTPVVIGEFLPETKAIFEKKAEEMQAPIIFAQEFNITLPKCQLAGFYQEKNKKTTLVALAQLCKMGWAITDNDITCGFSQVIERTNLQGRWQLLNQNPTIVCDTGHNEAGFRYITQQLGTQHYKTLHIVIGMVKDKDITAILALLPKKASYYFTRAVIPRALPENTLKQQAAQFGLKGSCYPSVKQALEAAKRHATEDDFIFVGGSNFVVAEIL